MNKNEKKHKFHFVLNNDLKNKIINLSVKLNKTLSKTIIFILNSTISIINKYQYNFDESADLSKYPTINWDTNAFIHIDVELFRKIKHIEGIMHAYSISVIIRKLLELYFHLLKLSGGKIERVERILKRFYLLHVKKFGTKIFKVEKNKKIMPQLCEKFLYTLTFNDKYCLTEIDFIKTD